MLEASSSSLPHSVTCWESPVNRGWTDGQRRQVWFVLGTPAAGGGAGLEPSLPQTPRAGALGRWALTRAELPRVCVPEN